MIRFSLCRLCQNAFSAVQCIAENIPVCACVCINVGACMCVVSAAKVYMSLIVCELNRIVRVKLSYNVVDESRSPFLFNFIRIFPFRLQMFERIRACNAPFSKCGIYLLGGCGRGVHIKRCFRMGRNRIVGQFKTNTNRNRLTRMRCQIGSLNCMWNWIRFVSIVSGMYLSFSQTECMDLIVQNSFELLSKRTSFTGKVSTKTDGR